jgi:hypothetical protein
MSTWELQRCYKNLLEKLCVIHLENKNVISVVFINENFFPSLQYSIIVFQTLLLLRTNEKFALIGFDVKKNAIVASPQFQLLVGEKLRVKQLL